MQILIEIPNPPKKQEIVDIPLHFIDGDICEAGGYEFKVLSPHGRLIDANKLFYEEVGKIKPRNDEHYKAIGEFMNMITNAPTIIEAEE